MNIFEIIISPFLFIIKKLFMLFYGITNNYGFSIVLLSFAISLILLPVFILIEKAKKKDDALKLKMKPLVDEIKRCYKGQERYYYLKTLHRQHNYSPIRALIPILSLLLQIPFFIAAYQFLEGFEPLAGISFLFIKDLNAPDGLLGSINILPIAMTVVNLLTAYFYTRHGNTNERKQMIVVAGIFLVLLFKLPSGLVLYWTMNNVFSFFRLFLTNPEVFKASQGSEKQSIDRLPDFNMLWVKYKQLFVKTLIVLTLVIMVSQLNWAFHNSFNDFILRILMSPFGGLLLTLLLILIIEISHRTEYFISNIEVKPVLFLGIFFLSVYLFLAGIFYFKTENIILLKLSFLFIIVTQAIGLLYFNRMKQKMPKVYYLSLAFLLSILVFIQIVNIISFITVKEFSLTLFNLHISVPEVSWLSAVSSGIIFSVICLPGYLRYTSFKLTLQLKYHVGLFAVSAIYISGLVFFWNPIMVYSSYSESFDFPAFKILVKNFPIFIITIVSLGLVYLLSPRKIKQFLLLTLVSVVILAFLYSSIIPFDVGTLQTSFYSNEINLQKGTIIYLFEALLVFAVFYFSSFLLKRKLNRQVLGVLVLLNIFMIIQSLYTGIGTGEFWNKKIIVNDESINEISFSKDKENILLFVIDGAQGWYMHDIVEHDQALKKVFQGFTYYPNTVAMGNYTYASMPSMMNGFEYSIENMNNQEERTITQKYTQATEQFYKNIKDRGYFFSSTIMKYSRIDHSKFDYYIPEWDPEWRKILSLEKPTEIWFTRLWENALFSCAPLFIKPKVYNNQKWLVKNNLNVNSSDLKKYNFVRVLPKISNTTSDTNNFIFIHSLFTHAPWSYISNENKLVPDVSPYKSLEWFTYEFAKWMNWMKENDVYDNTKIILVADHGPDRWGYKGETDPGSAPLVYSDNKNLSLSRFLHLNPLLMVKDFNEAELLKEDWRIMSNADVYAIAFGINDPTKGEPEDRTITTHFTRWHQDLYTRIKYENKAKFKVSGNMYDMNNWVEVTE